MSHEIEKIAPELLADLQQRLLQAEGHIQALTQVVKHLTAALEVHHGLDAEGLAQSLQTLPWPDGPHKPAAQQMVQQLAAELADARQYRLYKLLHDKYGLDVDLEGAR